MDVNPKTSRATTTTTATTSSSRLHNFSSFPKLDLKWGTRRQLAFVKPHSPNPPRSSSSEEDDDRGIEAVRQKLINDFREEAQQIQQTFLNGGKHSDTASDTAVDTAARPWNLRTRRAVCKDPHIEKFTVKFSPVNGVNGETAEVNGKRPMFSVSLSKKEVEEDFIALTGLKPVRRPKKRPKTVQRQLDAMFPGSWLTEITADMYKVDERPPDDRKK